MGDRDDKGRLLPGHSVGEATRIKPGEVRNPDGRIGGYERLDRILERLMLLDADALETYTPKTVGERVVLRQLKEAAGKDYKARYEPIKDIYDRLLGKPQQNVALEDKREIPSVAFERTRPTKGKKPKKNKGA